MGQRPTAAPQVTSIGESSIAGGIDFDVFATYQTTARMERKTLDQRAQMSDKGRLVTLGERNVPSRFKLDFMQDI